MRHVVSKSNDPLLQQHGEFYLSETLRSPSSPERIWSIRRSCKSNEIESVRSAGGPSHLRGCYRTLRYHSIRRSEGRPRWYLASHRPHTVLGCDRGRPSVRTCSAGDLQCTHLAHCECSSSKEWAPSSLDHQVAFQLPEGSELWQLSDWQW